MTTRDYVRVVREQWVLVTVIALIGVLVGLGTFLLRPAQYTATSSVYVSAQVGSDPQQAYLGAQLSAERVKSYTELVSGSRVTKEAAARLGLSDQETRDLAEHLEASSAVESVIISIAATEPSPQKAADVSNTVANVLSDVVEEIEKPSAPNGVAPVAARVVEPADPPVDPSSFGLALTLVIGLIGGLAVGLGAAFVRNSVDTGVKTVAELSRVSRLPVLGAIAFDESVETRPLAVHERPNGAVAEGIRQLRTNLQFVDVDKPRTVLMMTSPVESEGKSTTVANLAIALSATGSRVLVVEADLRRPGLSALMGVERAVGLTQVLAGRIGLERAIRSWGGAVDVLPCGPVPPNPSELMASEQMRALLADVRERYDIVLVDTSPILPVTDAAAIAPAVDGVVLVCRFRKTTAAQVEDAAAALRGISVEPVGAVLTMVRSGSRSYPTYGSYHGPDGGSGGSGGTDVSMPISPSSRPFGPDPQTPANGVPLGEQASRFGVANGVGAGRPTPGPMTAPLQNGPLPSYDRR